MHYLVIEKFKDAPAIYQRLEEKGRMMPEGLKYVSSTREFARDSQFSIALRVCVYCWRSRPKERSERALSHALMDGRIAAKAVQLSLVLRESSGG